MYVYLFKLPNLSFFFAFFFPSYLIWKCGIISTLSFPLSSSSKYSYKADAMFSAILQKFTTANTCMTSSLSSSWHVRETFTTFWEIGDFHQPNEEYIYSSTRATDDTRLTQLTKISYIKCGQSSMQTCKSGELKCAHLIVLWNAFYSAACWLRSLQYIFF